MLLSVSLIGIIASLVLAEAALIRHHMRANQAPAATPAPLPKSDSLAHIQMFATAQLLDLRRHGIDLATLKSAWLRERISFFLLGATDVIAHRFGCNRRDQEEVASFVLHKTLHMDYHAADLIMEKLNELEYHETSGQAFDEGRAVSRYWLTHRRTPNGQSLFDHINQWGLAV